MSFYGNIRCIPKLQTWGPNPEALATECEYESSISKHSGNNNSSIKSTTNNNPVKIYTL